MINIIERSISKRLNRYPILKSGIKKIYTSPFMFVGQFLKRPQIPHHYSEIGEPKKNSFFGYYDVRPDNSDGLVLCHQTALATQKEPDPNHAIEICVFSLEDPTIPIVKTTTKAYNWQQGARLQWLDKHRFIFNDFDPDNNQYIARIWDMAGKKEIATLTKPIQTLIDSDNFLSLNYQRLAKLRPDYGYFNLDPNDCDLTDTEQDGIYKFNITTGEHKLVYALADIISHDSKNQMRRLNHKINHLMISPNGKKMLMLHRMFDGQRRFGRLLLGDVDGTKLVTLPGDDMISHYCWADDDTIICYMRTNEAGDGYYQIKLSENRAYLMKTISDVLLGDGHPSFAGHNQFITDTYPDRYGYQRLYHCNSETNKVTLLASFYHPRRYSGVTRCDLHPRVSTDGLHCYFDTVNAGRRRLSRIAVKP